MAYLSSKTLFFTTSPRSPEKMIPEIELLFKHFEGQVWNTSSQEEFIDLLAKSDFYLGTGSPKNKALSARDRITRAPKALGFVDLKPVVRITESGNAFIFGERPREVLLRQLLKFQLPSPYHLETAHVKGAFHIRPYLEIFRLIREVDSLTFDELKIFALFMTDYRQFEGVKSAILSFREQKEKRKGEYRQLVEEAFNSAIAKAFEDEISEKRTQTRETSDASLRKFISVKRSNLRDYADACLRYLRFTGLVSLAHRQRKIVFLPERLAEVDYFLEKIDREPVFINDEGKYKKHLFSVANPVLLTDSKESALNEVMKLEEHTRCELEAKTVPELLTLRDEIVSKRKQAIIDVQVEEIKSYALYSEIIDTYNEILSRQIYDAPLMLEYNTWRAMTMLNGGVVKGNFKFDDAGQPLSTAPGNVPDVECDYDDFALSVEVTLQRGQRQYETEGEPVARHYGQLKDRVKKESYCLFVAPVVNPAALAHFYALNNMDIQYYGGKTQIIPLDLNQFMKLIEKSYSFDGRPNHTHVEQFLRSAIIRCLDASSEIEWKGKIEECVQTWLS